MSKSAIVAGYATVDFAARVSQPLQGPGTRTAVALARDRWPSAGGAALYASRCIAAAGHQAHPLAILGDDSNGAIYLQACDAANLSHTALVCTAEVRTPWCVLLYHDDGSYTCVLDHGDVNEQPLSAAQLSLAGSADLVCVAAGPVCASEQLLETIADSTLLAWIAKDDPNCFPDSLGARLARRADIVFCNSAERAMLNRARSHGYRANQSVIETRGSQGVVIDNGGAVIELTCDPLQVTDTTGAGDTLAGEVLAALLSGVPTMEDAARRGIDAARALLMQRA
jgi:ribokinase